MSIREKVLFVDTRFLTRIFNQENVEFDWVKAYVSNEYHRIYAYVDNPANKRSFVQYLTSNGVNVNESGVTVGEFMLQAHVWQLNGMDGAPHKSVEYVIIGHEQCLIDALHPVLNIRLGDMMSMHHAHEEAIVNAKIDAAPKNVFWHRATDCLSRYFKERR